MSDYRFLLSIDGRRTQLNGIAVVTDLDRAAAEATLRQDLLQGMVVIKPHPDDELESNRGHPSRAPRAAVGQALNDLVVEVLGGKYGGGDKDVDVYWMMEDFSATLDVISITGESHGVPPLHDQTGDGNPVA